MSLQFYDLCERLPDEIIHRIFDLIPKSVWGELLRFESPAKALALSKFYRSVYIGNVLIPDNPLEWHYFSLEAFIAFNRKHPSFQWSTITLLQDDFLALIRLLPGVASSAKLFIIETKRDKDFGFVKAHESLSCAFYFIRNREHPWENIFIDHIPFNTIGWKVGNPSWHMIDTFTNLTNLQELEISERRFSFQELESFPKNLRKLLIILDVKYDEEEHKMILNLPNRLRELNLSLLRENVLSEDRPGPVPIWDISHLINLTKLTLVDDRGLRLDGWRLPLSISSLDFSNVPVFNLMGIEDLTTLRDVSIMATGPVDSNWCLFPDSVRIWDVSSDLTSFSPSLRAKEIITFKLTTGSYAMPPTNITLNCDSFELGYYYSPSTFPLSDFYDFSQIHNLTSLLIESSDLVSLSKLKLPYTLQKLHLYGCGDLESLEGLEKLENLRSFGLDGCFETPFIKALVKTIVFPERLVELRLRLGSTKSDWLVDVCNNPEDYCEVQKSSYHHESSFDDILFRRCIRVGDQFHLPNSITKLTIAGDALAIEDTIKLPENLYELDLYDVAGFSHFSNLKLPDTLRILSLPRIFLRRQFEEYKFPSGLSHLKHRGNLVTAQNHDFFDLLHCEGPRSLRQVPHHAAIDFS
ncbi:hypothetical protein PICST_66350 [Scheffersomyces stipitis CBS 6054]|uniref:Uncharacterized protein n=1 Tax=Scheffersomyces stipitis (strain ATCC 58785 / CBS 6054 / NBRC 10063 / NRRL Y-11545) TaxID=322104 RepID=A3GFQ0_PICST|nr:hypothetical protein PICST_66350 [Scheffersomyces stipitis CBS 6054]EAZ63387.2 hypothetical protein PICST_66350 [Scheffersomyces stipitis CBS 6054]KAG2731721.1 hypothetical protein G9P44_005308 [Scheffersomyces stipitis]